MSYSLCHFTKVAWLVYMVSLIAVLYLVLKAWNIYFQKPSAVVRNFKSKFNVVQNRLSLASMVMFLFKIFQERIKTVVAGFRL